MMDNYLVVNKEVLPEIFIKVIQAKEMMEKGECSQVSEAVKKVGISRSAYYKYKDHVHSVNRSNMERRAVISFTLSHRQGTLSEVLHVLTSSRCNIITINQNIPIRNQARVTISIDVSEMGFPIEELVQGIAKVDGVSKSNLVSIE